MSNKQDRELVVEYWMALTREFPQVSRGRLIEIGNRLVYIAKASHRLAELACNQEVTSRQQARDVKLDEEVRALAAELGTTVVLQGDPRGAPVKVVCPSGYSNSFGGEGLVVPY